MSFVAGTELTELQRASSFKLNKVLFCLHGPFSPSLPLLKPLGETTHARPLLRLNIPMLPHYLTTLETTRVKKIIVGMSHQH